MTTDQNLASTAQTAAAGTSWLDYEHPEYGANKEKWKYASDHYSGLVLDSELLTEYLIKKDQGESDPSYEDRKKLASLTNDLATVIDGLVGQIAAVEGDANRVWTDDKGKGLGSHEDPDSPAYWLLKRASIDGQGWLSLWNSVAEELCVCNSLWIYARSVGDMPAGQIIPALSVPDWGKGPNGQMSFVKLIDKATTRSGPESPPVCENQWVVFTLEGWQRYRKDESGAAVKMSGPGDSGEYKYVDRDRRTPILPIFRLVLPLKRMVGYILARKQNTIFNQTSERNNLLRACGFPKLNVSGDAEHFKAVKDALARGANVLHAQPDSAGNTYDAPDSGPAAIQTAVIEASRKEFFQAGHKEYGDAAREATATEVRQDVSSGTGAFLQLLSSTLDSGENELLMRLEQVIHPTDPTQWFIARAERSDDFMPDDPDDVVDKQSKRVFGSDTAVPMGITARKAAAKHVVDYQGLPVEEGEIDAAVRVAAILEHMEALQRVGLAEIIPAAVKVSIGTDVLGAMGYLDPGKVSIDGMSDAKALVAQIQKDMLELARQAEERKKIESQFFGNGGPSPSPAE